VAPPASGEHHLEVWGSDGRAPQLLSSLRLSGPSELPGSFAVSGEGEMRLYFLWSDSALPGARVAAALTPLTDHPAVDGARVEWLGVIARTAP
jgi:hypothetical protein